MTSKVQTFIAAIAAGLFEFVAWFMMIPPEQQTELLSPIVELVPIAWRDDWGLWSKLIARLSAIYALFTAARSGPQTPPKNPATS